MSLFGDGTRACTHQKEGFVSSTAWGPEAGVFPA